MKPDVRKRYFSLDEANALVPVIGSLMARIRDLKDEIQEIINELEGEGFVLQQVFSAENIGPTEESYRRILEEKGDEINLLIDEVHDAGAVVKDLDLGLVDFYSRLNDDDVFLCWKLGEADIAHWHRLDEGFRQRKSLMQKDFLSQVAKIH